MPKIGDIKPHFLWLYLSDFYGWWFAGFLWPWPTFWCHLMTSTTYITPFRGKKPLKKCPKYAHFCLKWSKTHGVRSCAAIKPYLPKNIVSEGTFMFSKHCRAIASTCPFRGLKKSICLQIMLNLALYVVISILASPCHLLMFYICKIYFRGTYFGWKKYLGSLTPKGP